MDKRTPRTEPSASEVEIRIERLAAGGDGVGRAPDGRVVFVPFTAPGDLARIRLHSAHRRFWRGELVELLVASEQRSEPPCPAFTDCGGCSWQHLDYPAQLEARREILRDALVRIGKLDVPDEIELVASPKAYAYRTRSRVHVQDGHVGFRRRRSHEICAVDECAVLAPELNAALQELAQTKPKDGEFELLLEASDSVRCVPATRNGKSRPATVHVGSDHLRVSNGVFMQSNAAMLEPMAKRIVEFAGQGETLVELYAGCGTWTLGLARRFQRVWAVEASARAVADLEANLDTHSIENVEALAAPVEEALLKPPLRDLVCDVVMLDPPRTGLPRTALDAWIALGAKRIVYLSCDPATQARDLAVCARSGYRLDRIVALDLFPQTAHLESLALMTRL